MRKEPSVDLASNVAGATLTVGRTDLSDGASLSGHERNHLFLNDGRAGLVDASGLSGLDDPADGRALAWLDYDHDGWLDFAVVNANEPTLQLYRNEMSGFPQTSQNRSISVRLVGGNEDARPSEAWSNRDGIGARVRVRIGDRTLVRELRAGEGFAAQNSATLQIGVGDAESADRIEVHWPSGREQEAQQVAAGSRVTFHENPERAPEGKGVVAQGPPSAIRKAVPHRPRRERLTLSPAAGKPAAPLRVVTTTATWCETCRGELPDVARLRSAFPASELELIGLPVDPADTKEKLDEYTQRYRPAYRMVAERSESDVKHVGKTIEARLRREVLPASIVTNQDGDILDVFWGLPTVSDIRELQGK